MKAVGCSGRIAPERVILLREGTSQVGAARDRSFGFTRGLLRDQADGREARASEMCLPRMENWCQEETRELKNFFTPCG